jgi:hypothetical protein
MIQLSKPLRFARPLKKGTVEEHVTCILSIKIFFKTHFLFKISAPKRSSLFKRSNRRLRCELSRMGEGFYYSANKEFINSLNSFLNSS